MSYQYDQYERLKSVKIGDKTVCTNIYDGEGRLYRQITPECPEGIQYHYDTLGRLTGLSGQAELRITYDGVNRMDSLTTVADGKSLKTQYVYGTEKNNKSQIKEIRVNGTAVLSYGTDGLQRRISQTYQDAGGYQTTWEYKAGPSGNTTILPEKMTNGSSSLEYRYDAMNNITEIRENGTLIQSYAYDGQNQLVRENDVRKNETVTYAYDTGGNILTKKHYAYTTGSLEGKTPVSTDSYGYQNSGWKDLLTSYNGAPITYDGSGNATKWTGGRTFTWEAGKRLSGIQGGEGEVSYTYDVDGNRTSKTVGGEKTEYVLNGSQILSMKKGKERLDFLYDENSSLMGLEYNGTRYYYIRNAQLDIIGIIDRTGKQVVSYQYDAWGKVLPTTGELKWSVGVANPFRYRGYYYDQESGLYYLQSRYYDPVVGRFISADTSSVLTASPMEVTEKNLFAYCDNKPTIYLDWNGEDAALVFEWWTGSMWWLSGADGPLPIGDAVYIIGAGVLGIGAIICSTKKKNTSNLPHQGDVSEIPDAPPVSAGQQGKHVPGHPNNDKGKSQWNEGETGVKQTQEAWNNGIPDRADGSIRIGVASDGRVIRVHKGKGRLHGYPWKFRL